MIMPRARRTASGADGAANGTEQSVDKTVDKCFQTENKSGRVDNPAKFPKKQHENRQIIYNTTH